MDRLAHTLFMNTNLALESIPFFSSTFLLIVLCSGVITLYYDCRQYRQLGFRRDELVSRVFGWSYLLIVLSLLLILRGNLWLY